MTYDDGSEVMAGDRVKIERGQTPGIVERVIETDADKREWGVADQGVMVLSPPFGRVYWDVQSMERDPLVFEFQGTVPTE